MRKIKISKNISKTLHTEYLNVRLVFWLNIASYILILLGLFITLKLHLLPCLLSGLAIYEFTYALGRLFGCRLSGSRSRLITIAFLAMLIFGTFTIIVLLTIAHFKADMIYTGKLFGRVMDIVDNARGHLPIWTHQYLPNDIDDMRSTIYAWVHAHIGTLQMAGKEAVRSFAHVVIGTILGAIIAIDTAVPAHNGPLTSILRIRVGRVAYAFRKVVFAQIKISSINTILTTVFLLLILPCLNVKLPLAKILVLLTFIVGLIPVLGNLISNSLIIVSALSVSISVTLTAIVFLIVIHKLEYFLNARIVGDEIEAKAWELLLAMLLMEAMFGTSGLIAAPVYYAYMKQELRLNGLI